MRFLITGGTGFVGSAVVRKVLREGHNVRALVRSGSARDNLDSLPIEVVECELTDTAGLLGALTDCDGLFHVAADYRLWVPDPASMFKTNVEGTRCIMEAALKAGVKRVVYCSTVAIFKIGNEQIAVDEESNATPEDMVGSYKESKFAAEKLVREMVADKGLPAVIVNPTAPVGPRDIKPTPTGKMVIDTAMGKMFAYIETGLNIVHVDDVADGHWLAWEKGRIGERYILGGENLRLSQILSRICEFCGLRPPKVSIPIALLEPIAPIFEWIARLRGNEPLLHRDVLRMAKKYMYFSSAKAIRELGYAPRPVSEALRDSLCWFASNGYLGEDERTQALSPQMNEESVIPDELPVPIETKL